MHKLLSVQSLSILHCGAGLQPAMAWLTHWPLLVLQMSCVHVLPSLQSLASLHGGPQPAIGVAMQLPVDAWHESVVHELPSLHTLAVPLQVPPEHTSPLVHSELSLQVAVLWVCWQVPLLHASLVHGLLSLQAAPGWQLLPQFWIAVNWQLPPPPPPPPPWAQASAVHGLPSLHTTGVPEQTPFLHASCVVQPVPSLQLPVLSSVATHWPVVAEQASVVQALLSLHEVVAVGVHAPFWQVSPVVHSKPSSHEVPVSTWMTQVPFWQVSDVHGLLSLQSALTLHAPPQPAIAV